MDTLQDAPAKEKEEEEEKEKEKEKKSPSKGAGKPSKQKSSSKSRDKSGGRKGKKTKKAKKGDDDVVIDPRINPEADSPPINVFLPDRSLMQTLVTRAAQLKLGKDRAPEWEQVRPWIRINNPDIMI